jgi:MFS family permease
MTSSADDDNNNNNSSEKKKNDESSSSSSRQEEVIFEEQGSSPSNKMPLLLLEPGSSPNNKMPLSRDTIPTVVPQRWVQLAYISILALLSDWICFSVAAVPDVYGQAYSYLSSDSGNLEVHSAATLIDMFLFTNVASCFLVTDVVDKIGLQRAIQSAALLMAVGCWFRSGFDFITPSLAAAAAGGAPLLLSSSSITSSFLHLVPDTSMVIGTILVGAAQPFFQCTPPLLSATWFASQERATSTAIALNFNQVGIATAFVVGGSMATTIPGMASYFGLVSILATLAAIGTCLQFENEPLIPPSASELEKKLAGAEEPPFLESVKTFFKTKGFSKALVAFICSISTTNIVGAFIDEILTRGGMDNQFQIGLAGAGFEVAILVGGMLIGGYVDKTKQYKNVTLACLVASALFCIPLGLTQHAIGTQPLLLVAALLGLGFSTGPVQPINAELAVDVTYPGDETAVESVQQIGGNLISALLVPVAELLVKQDYTVFTGNAFLESDLHGDAILLVALSLGTIVYFSTFDAPLKRSMADKNSSDDDDVDAESDNNINENNNDIIGTSVAVVVDNATSATTTMLQQDSEPQQEQQRQ